eukprot:TRINITY_DN9099_c0_g1_i2.p1 TRINITY_DN9099_c0_g1~~TRINITY_DN9099_c0_g1_i2.p1  ORF type:complete len:649 (-),score=159.93 TRINITY_DN9099_c0_g1_i2:28-1974(-)
MVSRYIFDSANSLFSTIGEVVAPSVDTPLESFKFHWKSIRNFYIDEKYDVESFQEAEVPEHLISMITILLEEERDFHRNGPRSSFQPCLEFFMSNKIMEILCILGEKNKPRGIRKLVFTAINQLLSDMPHSIIPNMSVHKPIKTLVERCALVNDVEGEFSELLKHLVDALKKEPLLVSSFFVEHEVNGTNEKTVDFPILTGLLNHRNDNGVSGDNAKEGLAKLLQIQDREVMDYLQNCTNLTTVIVADLNNWYKSLPTEKGNSISAIFNSAAFVGFKSQMQFVVSLVNNSHKDVAAPLVQQTEDDFLNSVFAPSLLQPDETGAALATIYLREIVFAFSQSKDLMQMLVNYLLGDCSEPETEEEESEHMIRSTLLRRLESNHEELSVNTLKLFEGLVRMNNKQVMYNLILRTLIPRYHLLSDKKEENENLQSSIAKFLTLFSESDFNSTFASGYEAYLLDAQDQIMICKKACFDWGNDSQLNSSVIADSSENSENPEDNEEKVLLFYGGGLFFKMLFDKLENVLNQPLESNLMLTGIFTTLAHYPIPLLYSFLLNAQLPLRPGIRSLHSVLVQVSGQIEQRRSLMQNYPEELNRARQEVTEEVATTTSTKPEDISKKNFLQAVIVLEEFCKELAATAGAQNSSTYSFGT